MTERSHAFLTDAAPHPVQFERPIDSKCRLLVRLSLYPIQELPPRLCIVISTEKGAEKVVCLPKPDAAFSHGEGQHNFSRFGAIYNSPGGRTAKVVVSTVTAITKT